MEQGARSREQEAWSKKQGAKASPFTLPASALTFADSLIRFL
ncbi:MAG: hypothetical protein ABSG35_11110 [Syntrophobacteraceae bacterium]